mmetsp:Transcript_16034/g.22389  ORF Transcript_16034/g.22389 Transcript_16034/m.22389 type:complete len:179 (-) Transcript_16034:98-634(-)
MRRAVLPCVHKLLLYLCLPVMLSSGCVPMFLRAARAFVLLSKDGIMLSMSRMVVGIVKSLQPELDLANTTDAVFEVETMCARNYCFRLAFLAMVVFELCSIMGSLFEGWYNSVKQSMFEERYLIGKRLHNFGETVKPESKVSVETKESKLAVDSKDDDGKTGEQHQGSTEVKSQNITM